MAEGYLTLRAEGDLAHLVLSSPPKNEMGRGFFDELDHLVCESIPRLRPLGLVVRGDGRHFSSGADVAVLRHDFAGSFRSEAQAELLRASLVLQALADFPFPVVAAIGGVCLGSGLELALACHSRVAARNAVFSLPETTFGLMPGCGGTQRLPVLTGLAKALEWILTGRMVTADEALEAGLVDAVVDRRAVVAAAETLARRLAGGGGR